MAADGTQLVYEQHIIIITTEETCHDSMWMPTLTISTAGCAHYMGAVRRMMLEET